MNKEHRLSDEELQRQIKESGWDLLFFCIDHNSPIYLDDNGFSCLDGGEVPRGVKKVIAKEHRIWG